MEVRQDTPKRRHPVLHVLWVSLFALPVIVLTLPIAMLAYPALLGLAFAGSGAAMHPSTR